MPAATNRRSERTMCAKSSSCRVAGSGQEQHIKKARTAHEQEQGQHIKKGKDCAGTRPRTACQ
eukprot:1160858-Pelagomonas_calceolata.AAC.13